MGGKDEGSLRFHFQSISWPVREDQRSQEMIERKARRDGKVIDVRQERKKKNRLTSVSLFLPSLTNLLT